MALRPGWAESLDTGGGLIDIVVADMTVEDWSTVHAYFAARPRVWSPDGRGDRLLARGDLPGRLNAWFLGDELEIDLQPRELTEDAHVVTLQQFMRELGQLLHRDVTMSWEGMRDAVVFRYRYATDSMVDASAASGAATEEP